MKKSKDDIMFLFLEGLQALMVGFILLGVLVVGYAGGILLNGWNP